MFKLLHINGSKWLEVVQLFKKVYPILRYWFLSTPSEKIKKQVSRMYRWRSVIQNGLAIFEANGE